MPAILESIKQPDRWVKVWGDAHTAEEIDGMHVVVSIGYEATDGSGARLAVVLLVDRESVERGTLPDGAPEAYHVMFHHALDQVVETKGNPDDVSRN